MADLTHAGTVGMVLEAQLLGKTIATVRVASWREGDHQGPHGMVVVFTDGTECALTVSTVDLRDPGKKVFISWPAGERAGQAG